MINRNNTNLTMVVGGATSSIAKSLITELAQECQILPLVRRKVDKNLFKVPVEPVEIDYFSKESCTALGNLIAAKSNIIFINFSVHSEDRLFLNQSVDDFIDTFKVNVLTNLYPLQTLIPKMISSKWGRIIFVASTRGIRGDIGIAPYSASKSALLGLSGTLSKEYGKFGITSNVLSLGYFSSELLNKIPDNKLKVLMSAIPGRKIGNGKDIAAAVRMLIDTDYVNGSVIEVDGGA